MARREGGARRRRRGRRAEPMFSRADNDLVQAIGGHGICALAVHGAAFWHDGGAQLAICVHHDETRHSVLGGFDVDPTGIDEDEVYELVAEVEAEARERGLIDR